MDQWGGGGGGGGAMQFCRVERLRSQFKVGRFALISLSVHLYLYYTGGFSDFPSCEEKLGIF